jgi:hypothetical protein
MALFPMETLHDVSDMSRAISFESSPLYMRRLKEHQSLSFAYGIGRPKLSRPVLPIADLP